MRAIYYSFDNSKEQSHLLITDETVKHLNVVRAKLNDEVLVLNGRGLKAFTKISSISKNQIELAVQSVQICQAKHLINLAIATPKKDAFEDVLKMAVELGVLNIYPLTSEFSQYDYIASDRVQRILESALIQSNNPFMPVIHAQTKLTQYLDNLSSPLFFFNSRDVICGKGEKINEEKTILIGPEGGFSDSEITNISSRSNVFPIHLPTPILRAPTAVATSIGYLLTHS